MPVSSAGVEKSNCFKVVSWSIDGGKKSPDMSDGPNSCVSSFIFDRITRRRCFFLLGRWWTLLVFQLWWFNFCSVVVVFCFPLGNILTHGIEKIPRFDQSWRSWEAETKIHLSNWWGSFIWSWFLVIHWVTRTLHLPPTQDKLSRMKV